MTIRELVGGGASVVSVAPDATLQQAAREMAGLEVGSAAVLVDDDLEGIITERDLLGAVAKGVDCNSEQVSGWMTPLPDTFSPDMTVADAATWMLGTGYRHLPVVDVDGTLLGMVSIKDILWAVTDTSGR